MSLLSLSDEPPGKTSAYLVLEVSDSVTQWTRIFTSKAKAMQGLRRHKFADIEYALEKFMMVNCVPNEVKVDLKNGRFNGNRQYTSMTMEEFEKLDLSEIYLLNTTFHQWIFGPSFNEIKERDQLLDIMRRLKAQHEQTPNQVNFSTLTPKQINFMWKTRMGDYTGMFIKKLALDMDEGEDSDNTEDEDDIFNE